MIQVLLVINYFNQPYYSYGKKSILAGFCAFISLFWKKEKKNKNLCFSSSVCIVYWWFIRNGFQCLRYWPGRHTKASSTGVKPRRSPTGFPPCVSQAPPHTLSPIAGSVSRHFLRGPGQGALADRLRLSAPRPWECALTVPEEANCLYACISSQPFILKYQTSCIGVWDVVSALWGEIRSKSVLRTSFFEC